MKRHRLWIAAPVLAFSLLALPAINAEAASDVAYQSEALFAEMIEGDRAVLNSTIITEKEAIAKIAADLAANKPSTTFTVVLKTGENSGEKIQSYIDQAKAVNEYVYGVGAGYGYLGSTMTTGNETQVTVHLYYNYHLLNSEFKSFNFQKDADIAKHAAAVAIVQQREQEITDYVKNVSAELFKKDMTEFEKVKAAYDYIILNTKYGKTNTQGFGKGHSPYSIVKEGVGVCQAYALLFQRLMDEAGIESKYIIGERVAGKTADGKIVKEGHAWNVVTIDDKTYHIDATHGDPIGSHLSEDFISYQTFLLSEQKILQHGHIITEKRPYVKPVSERFSTWQEVSEPLVFNGSIYYTVLEGTYIKDNQQYGVYAFKQGTVNEKTGELTSKKLTFGEGKEVRNVIAEHATIFNNQIFFSNYNDGARLWTLNADGTYDLMKDLYNNGKNNLPQVGAIKVVNDELLAYDYSSPNTIVYREKKKEPELPPITGPVTAEQIAEAFTADSPTVKAIESAKSQEAFEELLKQLASFVGAESDNPELAKFKKKVEGYNEVKKKVAETKVWANEIPPVKDVRKSWTIQFSEPIAFSDMKPITVTDIFGKSVTANVSLNNDAVIVEPLEDYEKGATYYLIIPAGFKSANGDVTTEAISVAFTPQ
ncbi:transglutaminase domain-containing protein [Caryophanon latum]|uniref:Transglutaminase-like domain-containing protein n=1 Tax=Caryophanon latum TaxID=33977 RepID=A0A1C0YTE7_9BACL|nr:transglutaminase domain-containing protein [Caryophanon latum]OCS90430.1 hypothetical protein A6K76_11230 [Caryophanon latum]